jgi:hypothetical protein
VVVNNSIISTALVSRSHTLSKPRPCVNGALPVAINAASTCSKVNQKFVKDALMRLNMQQKSLI